MDRPKVRPTFAISLQEEANQAMDHLRERLKTVEHRDCTHSKGRCAEFYIPEEERRLWSPYLSVQVEARREGSLLRGRFGPHPEVWTLYMFLSSVLAFFALIGLILGFVQWQSGMDAWGFWGAVLGLPGLLALYLISAAGQRLSAHQMDELKGRLDPLLDGLESQEKV